MRRTGFLWDERYMWHDTGRRVGPAWPVGWTEPIAMTESPESKRRLRNLLDASGLLDRLIPLKPRAATEAELLRFHTPDYLARIKALSAEFGGDGGDGLTPFGPGSYEIALLAAGGATAAVDAVLDGEVDNVYALVRPPGHHAERDRGRGYCLFANTALAAIHARQDRGLARVAIVDWDVHHGNGTQQAFYEDPSVLTISIHQDGKFPPESGTLAENGARAGLGYNLNVPLPAGSGDGAYAAAFEQVVAPALDAFRPELILVASGLDANALDPLGRMMCTSDGYRTLTQSLLEAADRWCGGKLAIIHEGGYAPEYVPFCGLAVIETLCGERSAATDPFLGLFSAYPGQELTAWQQAAIDQAAALIDRIAPEEASRRDRSLR